MVPTDYQALMFAKNEAKKKVTFNVIALIQDFRTGYHLVTSALPSLSFGITMTKLNGQQDSFQLSKPEIDKLLKDHTLELEISNDTN